MTPKEYDEQLGDAVTGMLHSDIGECIDPDIRSLEPYVAEIAALRAAITVKNEHIEWLTKEYHDVCLKLANLRISVRNALKIKDDHKKRGRQDEIKCIKEPVMLSAADAAMMIGELTTLIGGSARQWMLEVLTKGSKEFRE